MAERSLVLLSGGADSATVLAQEVKEGYTVIPLHIDYGQRGARMERARCGDQARTCGVTLETLDASSLGKGFRRIALKNRHVPFPHRNLVILSMAVSYAHERACTRIGLAINRDDTEDHPAASAAFFEAFRAMASTLDKRFEIVAPLIGLRKADVVRLGLSLGVDFAKTYSCLLGRKWHCGACPQCAARKAAFAAAGVPEPKHFYERGGER